MYKIKGKDSNGNKFKIKLIMADTSGYKDIYCLSRINSDGTRSYKMCKSLGLALTYAIGDTTKSNTVTLKVKIKGSDKRIEVVGGSIKGDITISTQYCLFIGKSPAFDRYYTIDALAIGLSYLIREIELAVECRELESLFIKEHGSTP